MLENIGCVARASCVLTQLERIYRHVKKTEDDEVKDELLLLQRKKRVFLLLFLFIYSFFFLFALPHHNDKICGMRDL